MENIRQNKRDNAHSFCSAFEATNQSKPRLPANLMHCTDGGINNDEYKLFTFICHADMINRSKQTRIRKQRADIIHNNSDFILLNSFDYTNLISDPSFKFSEKCILDLEKVNNALVDAIASSNTSLNSSSVREALEFMYDLLGRNTKYKSLLLMNIDCPYCNIDEATTLDHYLPKKYFPLYSANPWNFIPTCSRCNSIKQSYYPKNPNGIPFFNPLTDDFENPDYNWLAVEIIESNAGNSDIGIVPCFSYHLNKPKSMPIEDYSKLEFTFNKLQLAARYSRCLNRDLNNKRSTIAAFNTTSQLASYFNTLYHLTSYSIQNHWRPIAYKTIASDDKIQRILFNRLCSHVPEFSIKSNLVLSHLAVEYQPIEKVSRQTSIPIDVFDNFCSILRLNNDNASRLFYCIVVDISVDTISSDYVITNKLLPKLPNNPAVYVFVKNHTECKFAGRYIECNANSPQKKHHSLLRRYVEKS